MEKVENKYYLILEKVNRPGDYSYINISDLPDGKNYNSSDINSIDSYTFLYSKEELIDIIKKENIVTIDYILEGELKIIKNNGKMRLPVTYKEMFESFNLVEFITMNIKNKNLMNTLYNKYAKLNNQNNIEFKKLLEEEKISELVNYINNLEYVKRRMLYFYIIEKMNFKKPKVKELLPVA